MIGRPVARAWLGNSWRLLLPKKLANASSGFGRRHAAIGAEFHDRGPHRRLMASRSGLGPSPTHVRILGNLASDFNFNQRPRSPVLLPVHPKTTLTGTPRRARPPVTHH